MGDTELWQLKEADHVPGATSMSGVERNKLSGAAVNVCNLNGGVLVVNNYIQLCYSAEANVWTILNGGGSSVILVNLDYKVALASVRGMIALKFAYEEGITDHLWSINMQYFEEEQHCLRWDLTLWRASLHELIVLMQLLYEIICFILI